MIARGLVLAAAVVMACGPATLRPTVDGSPSRQLMAEFWVEPGRNRNLYHGAWGARLAPRADTIFMLEGTNPGGFSPKWDVKDPSGREWGVKMGTEAQSEVTTSRILWGMGYHQPPNYYLAGARVNNGSNVQHIGPGRFRPEIEELDDTGEWAWRENPFVNTPPYRGLLVLLMMLNSTDLKDDNNSVYELGRPRDGVRRWYVVRDVGSSLGDTGWTPNRNDIDAFEKEPFVTGIEDGYVQFEDRGRHTSLLERLRPADVVWTCERLQRFTDRQWRDAFRAGGYDQQATERYLRKLREKIAEGLALKSSP
jgi:hypothetical protein